MEIYNEQYVINDDPKRNKKKKIVFLCLFIFSLASACVALLMTYLQFAMDGLTVALILPAVMAVGLCVSAFFIRRFASRLDVDYDYILSGERFMVIRVFNKKRRKKYLELNIKNMGAMGSVKAEDSFNRYFATPQIKKLYANLTDDEEKLYFAYFSEGAEKSILIFQPDEQTLLCMRRVIGRDFLVKK